MVDEVKSAFMTLYQGFLQGVMKWDDWDALTGVLKTQKDKGWYVYHVGGDVPVEPATGEQFLLFLDEVDQLLKQEHDENYCGIVYVSDLQQPRLVKIYDPNNLGVVCGFSENPPLPGWVISLEKPDDLQQAFPPVKARQRWWKKIFS